MFNSSGGVAATTDQFTGAPGYAHEVQHANATIKELIKKRKIDPEMQALIDQVSMRNTGNHHVPMESPEKHEELLDLTSPNKAPDMESELAAAIIRVDELRHKIDQKSREEEVRTQNSDLSSRMAGHLATVFEDRDQALVVAQQLVREGFVSQTDFDELSTGDVRQSCSQLTVNLSKKVASRVNSFQK